MPSDGRAMRNRGADPLTPTVCTALELRAIRPLTVDVIAASFTLIVILRIGQAAEPTRAFLPFPGLTLATVWPSAAAGYAVQSGLTPSSQHARSSLLPVARLARAARRSTRPNAVHRRGCSFIATSRRRERGAGATSHNNVMRRATGSAISHSVLTNAQATNRRRSPQLGTGSV